VIVLWCRVACRPYISFDKNDDDWWGVKEEKLTCNLSSLMYVITKSLT
jgi:hypothetical protein